MRVALLDLGIGNLHSLGKALERQGGSVSVTTDPEEALESGALVLPGVGAFGPAADRLADSADAIRERLDAGLPCLGICLGMQLLYEGSEEASGRGIGLLTGRVRRLHADRTPQMGWNEIRPEGDDPLLEGLEDPVVYYANRYVAPGGDPGRVLAWSEYEGDRFPAIVRHRNTWATQFHPEKSGPVGLGIVANFIHRAEMAREEET